MNNNDEFDFESNEAIGTVASVDTHSVVVDVKDDEKLRTLQVNHLVALASVNLGQYLIGLVVRIVRKRDLTQTGDLDESGTSSNEEADIDMSSSHVKILLVGTHFSKYKLHPNVFKRSLETVPNIDADCFVITGGRLTFFMNSITDQKVSNNPLKIGNYVLNAESAAMLDGNKFFQRHATIVGSTGSGKSWTVAKIIEEASKLEAVNAIVYDIHGEYGSLAEQSDSNICSLKIAGPNDAFSAKDDNVLFVPYWLLTYEETSALLLDRTDQNAPNQSRALFDLIQRAKREHLENAEEKEKAEDILANFTIDSPIPYSIKFVIEKLNFLDTQRVPGVKGEKAGPLQGKLTRFVQRLETKSQDKRMNFLFRQDKQLLTIGWLSDFAHKLMGYGKGAQGVKILDMSDVPSDILPLIAGIISRVVFSIQQWTNKEVRHPIALFCDEAHLYIEHNSNESKREQAINSFERIAKEGRKYGVGLVVITQRPSDVNRAVLSQSNNYVAMRLMNAEDRSVIKHLFPDSLGDFAEMLPILDTGEALVVGDASLLPARIRVTAPTIKPTSATIDFWDKWGESKKDHADNIQSAVTALQKQSK